MTGRIAVLLALFMIALSNTATACYCIGFKPSLDGASMYNVVILDPDEADSSLVRGLAERGTIVLAYINIGYAEEWRSYWINVSRAGIVHGPTEYEGEYFVEYWSPAWRSIILGYARKALAEGFTGVYLDNIDAAMVLREEKPGWAGNVDPVEAIIELVSSVDSVAGLVYVNIGAAVGLLYNNSLLNHVDGVLREEVFHQLDGLGRLSSNPYSGVKTVLDALVYARMRGKTVIVVEFVTSLPEALIYSVFYSMLGLNVILQSSLDPYYEDYPITLNPGSGIV